MTYQINWTALYPTQLYNVHLTEKYVNLQLLQVKISSILLNINQKPLMQHLVIGNNTTYLFMFFTQSESPRVYTTWALTRKKLSTNSIKHDAYQKIHVISFLQQSADL